MPIDVISRRAFLAGASALAAGAAVRPASAQSGSIVAMTFPGAWEQAARTIIVPAYKKASPASVTLSPVLIVDAIAKLTASKDNPPYDVILIDEPATIIARNADLIEPLPRELIPNLAKVPDKLIGKDGYGVMAAMQVFGIAYNPKKIATPPTSWEDLWNPAYKGRVLISGPDTTIGMVWMVALAKMHGGSESNLDPAWKALEKLRPNLATIPPNPGAVGPLFQQGEADIAVGFLSIVEPMRARGVDIAIAKPGTGWGIVSNIAQLVKRTKSREAAAAYINTLLDPEVQTKTSDAPYFSVPTNRGVKFTGALAQVAADLDELVGSINVDWAPLLPQRRELIDKFNRDFRKA